MASLAKAYHPWTKHGRAESFWARNGGFLDTMDVKKDFTGVSLSGNYVLVKGTVKVDVISLLELFFT